MENGTHSESENAENLSDQRPIDIDAAPLQQPKYLEAPYAIFDDHQESFAGQGYVPIGVSPVIPTLPGFLAPVVARSSDNERSISFSSLFSAPESERLARIMILSPVLFITVTHHCVNRDHH